MSFKFVRIKDMSFRYPDGALSSRVQNLSLFHKMQSGASILIEVIFLSNCTAGSLVRFDHPTFLYKQMLII